MKELLKLVHRKDRVMPLNLNDKIFSIDGHQKHRIIFSLENVHMVQTFVDDPSIVVENYRGKSFFWLSGVELITRYFGDKLELKNEFQFKLEEYLLIRI